MKSADRTALLANQNPDLILAILNMLRRSHPSTDQNINTTAIGYGLETGTLRLQRPRLVVVSRGPQGHDVTLGLGLGYMSFRCEL